jgi:acyl carrier protein
MGSTRPVKAESAVYSALEQIFLEVFERDDIILEPTLTAQDVAGWDSFKQVEIIMACEERFGIKFTTRELDALTALGDLVALIAVKAA